MSALPPITGITQREWQARFMPTGDIAHITPAMHLGLYDMYV
jgi:hypothetical protein